MQSFCKKLLKNKLDPFNAYASVIDSISTVRFAWYTWNWKGRRCEKPSKFKAALFYAQVVVYTIFMVVSFISYGWYFLQTDKVHLSSAVSDGLILIGITYGFFYQLSSLLYGREAEFHITQQSELNKGFAELLKVTPSDKWNSGILYLFCQMCNGTRPNFGVGTFPYFLKRISPMSMYFRLDGTWGSLEFFLYAAWSSYSLGLAYIITNYYAIMALGHTAFNSFWLKCLSKRSGNSSYSESDHILATKIYKSLQILNILYHPAYGKLILPSVLIFASAWAVLAIVVILKLRQDMDALAMFMILMAASQAIGFLSTKFYFSHRMREDSYEYLESRKGADARSPYWSRVRKTLRPIGVTVGGFYMISIPDLQTWAEAMINYIILTLAAF